MAKLVPQICIDCDSQSVIGKAQNSMYNGKSRFVANTIPLDNYFQLGLSL